MAIYERLADQDRSDRQSLADAIEVLREKSGFGSADVATVDVGPLKLPSGQIVGLVQIFFNTPAKTFVVSLPTASDFVATPANCSRPERFDPFLFDGACVNCSGRVILKDGTKLRAIQILAARVTPQPSELDWKIIHATVKAIGAEKRCYRRLTDRAPRRFLRFRPYKRSRLLRKPIFNEMFLQDEVRFLDCRALRGLRTPPLKELTYRLAELCPQLRNVSAQKIADALRIFGVRIPASRPRRISVARREVATI